MLVPRAAELVQAAREDIGWSVEQLAHASDLPAEVLRQIEAGSLAPSAELLRRVLTAARTRPSIPLAVHADAIRELAADHGLYDVRVFGSVARGRDTPASDIDLLVTPERGTDLFDLGAFVVAVESLTGFPVDVITADLSGDEHFSQVLDEAVPL